MLVILKAFKQCMMKNQFIHIRHTCVYYFLMCIGWFNRYEVIGILLLIYSCLSIIRYYTKYAIAGFLQKKDIAGWCYIIDGWLIVSIALSIYDKDFTWLSRFGSIATCYCAFGSIQRAMMYVRNASAENPAYIFSKHLKLSIPIWNDDKNMTKEKVIKTMRDFANSL